MVTELDMSVGEVISALGKRGMLQNSIVILSTDNGGASGGLNLNLSSNWPLRGSKDTVSFYGAKK
jgi:arylsulfatase B